MDVYKFRATLEHSKNIHSGFIYISTLQENSMPGGSNRQKASTLISVTYIHNFTPYNCKTSMFVCVCECVSLFSLTRVVKSR